MIQSKGLSSHLSALGRSRFQVPVRRQADYMNYAHSIYGDAWTIIRATPCRAGRWEQGDRDAWRQVAGEFTVVNEWLKQGQTTLFVERELGEVLKRTDLPEGFCPQDLRWRWNAFRLVLPLGLFRVKFRMDDPHQEGWDTDIPIVTVAKVLKGQSLDFHRTFSRKPKRRSAVNRWATHGLTKMQCSLAFNAGRPTRSTKKSSISSAGANWTTERSAPLRKKLMLLRRSFLSGTPIRAPLSSGSNDSFLTPFCTWVLFLKSTSLKRSCGLSPKRRAGGNRR